MDSGDTNAALVARVRLGEGEGIRPARPASPAAGAFGGALHARKSGRRGRCVPGCLHTGPGAHRRLPQSGAVRRLAHGDRAQHGAQPPRAQPRKGDASAREGAVGDLGGRPPSRRRQDAAARAAARGDQAADGVCSAASYSCTIWRAGVTRRSRESSASRSGSSRVHLHVARKAMRKLLAGRVRAWNTVKNTG